MAHPPYYSPRLDRDLISQLYYAARGRGEPMTRLASTLVREGLVRLAESNEIASAVLRETPPADDPRGRQD
jgi:hypothetical protein